MPTIKLKGLPRSQFLLQGRLSVQCLVEQIEKASNLCALLGEDIATGRLPKSKLAFIHKMVGAICYRNAKSYFQF